MKAILVVDLPFDISDVNGQAYVTIMSRSGEVVNFPYVGVKSIPCKRETQVHWKSIGGGDIPTHDVTEYDKGWNDCVEFLEGEEND